MKPSLARLTMYFVLVTIFAVTLFFVIQQPVYANGGFVNGVITDEKGQPLQGALVQAFVKIENGYWFPAHYSISDESGAYHLAIPDTLPSTCRIRVAAQGYFVEYYDGASELENALDIPTNGDSVGNINIQLQPDLTRITGRVTDSTGNPIAQVSVSPYLQMESGFWGNVPLSAQTDANGVYTTPTLPPGTYHLQFIDTVQPKRYVSEFYNNAVTLQSGTDIVLPSGQIVTGIDLDLTSTGAITGIVGDETGDLLPNVRVAALRDVDNNGTLEEVVSDHTDDLGQYELTGLDPNLYLVRFETWPKSFATEYFDNATTSQTAINVAVTANTTTSNIDAQLSLLGTISGTISDESENRLSQIKVNLSLYEDSAWRDWREATTDADGNFAIDLLDSGRYYLTFQDTRQPPRYGTELFRDTLDLEQATILELAPGTMTTTVVAKLNTLGRIIGQVTDERGQPIYGVNVQPKWLRPNQYRGAWTDSFSTAQTNEEGQYILDGLRPGTYRLFFSDGQQPSRYISEYYENVSLFEEGTDLVLVEGGQLEAVNAQLKSKGSIQGTVTGADGNVVGGILVTLFISPSPNLWGALGEAWTNEEGRFSFVGLEADSYRLRFSDFQTPARFATEYFESADQLETAKNVVVNLGENITVDAQLESTSQLSGIVTDKDGLAVGNMTVQLFKDIESNDSWSYAPYTTESNEAGEYTLSGIDRGVYRLGFSDQTQPRRYSSEFFDDELQILDAQTFTITANQTITANAQLGGTSEFSGVVTNEQGVLLEAANVYLSRKLPGRAEWESIAFAQTDSNGSYLLSNLSAGVYQLCFGGPSEPSLYSGECYNDQWGTPFADDIVLTTDSARKIDAELGLTGAIGGKVTDSDGLPVAGIQVALYSNQVNGQWFGIAFGPSNEQGDYLFTNLNAGLYNIWFNDQGAISFADEYFEDADSLATSTNITLTFGTTLTNISAQLDRLSTISGTITDSSGKPLENIRAQVANWMENEFGGNWVLDGPQTDSNAAGEYIIRGVSAGKHVVAFFDLFPSQYDLRYYGGAFYPELARQIQVPVSTTITGIDIQMTLATEVNIPPYVKPYAFSVSEGGRYESASQVMNPFLFQPNDPEGELVTGTIVTSPTHGIVTLESDGIFTYKHDGSEANSDAFTFMASDGLAGSNVATATIMILPVNDAPIALNDVFTLTAGTSITDDLFVNDLDVDSELLTATLISSPTHGLVEMGVSGTFSYTHLGNEATTDSFVYQATDGISTSTLATVSLTIQPPPNLVLATTLGIETINPPCSTGSEVHVPVSTTLIYCYTVQNTGKMSYSVHSLQDELLGLLLDNVRIELAPGQRYTHTFTQTVSISSTGVATWTAGITTIVSSEIGSFADSLFYEQANGTIKIIVSNDTDDQDQDDITDNLERADDLDLDNVPNFLDIDSDGDTINDQNEADDADSNGIPDFLEPSVPRSIIYLPLVSR